MSEKRIYDAATRRRLAGTLPFSKDACVPFSPDHLMDLADDVRPILMLGTFSEEDRKTITDWAKIKDASFEEMLVKVMSGSGIRTWSNICDLVTGDELEFNVENVERMKDTSLIREAYTRCGEFSGMFQPDRPSRIEAEALG